MPRPDTPPNIAVNRVTHAHLEDMGRKGQTFDQIVSDLLEYALLTLPEFKAFSRGRMEK